MRLGLPRACIEGLDKLAHGGDVGAFFYSGFDAEFVCNQLGEVRVDNGGFGGEIQGLRIVSFWRTG